MKFDGINIIDGLKVIRQLSLWKYQKSDKINIKSNLKTET